MATCATISLMVGAGITGRLIQFGRRRVLIWSAFIGMVGISLTLLMTYEALVLGRLIYGFSVGLIAVAMPRLMEETVPGYLVGFFGSMYALSFSVATLIAFTLAVFLPPESETQLLVQSQVTRVICGLPLVFYVA